MTDAFVKFPKSLMQATHWVSLSTGELITLTPMQKILWLHIKDRHDFFIGQRMSWFESQQVIAQTLGCDRSTVNVFLDLLEKHGYIVVTRRIVRGCQQSNSYSLVADLQVQHVSKGKRIDTGLDTIHDISLPVQSVPQAELPELSSADDADDPFPVMWENPAPVSVSRAGNSDMHV